MAPSLASPKPAQLSEKKFQALLKHSHEAVLMFNENFDIVYRTDSTERILGCAMEEG